MLAGCNMGAWQVCQGQIFLRLAFFDAQKLLKMWKTSKEPTLDTLEAHMLENDVHMYEDFILFADLRRCISLHSHADASKLCTDLLVIPLVILIRDSASEARKSYNTYHAVLLLSHSLHFMSMWTWNLNTLRGRFSSSSAGPSQMTLLNMVRNVPSTCIISICRQIQYVSKGVPSFL